MMWLRSTIYFLLLSAAVTFLFLPGLDFAAGHETVANGVLLIILAVVVCYVLTAFFLKGTPGEIFSDAPRRTFAELLRTLPKLIGSFAIFALAFAVISGLLALFLYYVIFAGQPPFERKTAVLIAAAVLVVLSSPFFAQAYAIFAGGEGRFRLIFANSLRMGGRLYGKYLILGAVSYGLALLIRLVWRELPEPFGLLLMLALTSVVFGVAIPVSWIWGESDRKGEGENNG
jgi:hypothetical protein